MYRPSHFPNLVTVGVATRLSSSLRANLLTRGMSDPPSSCVPATFQTPDGEDAVAPKQLLEFLRSLIQRSTADGDKPVYDRASWVTMISGLADQVYGHFPYFTSIKQGTTNERITLTHVSLDVLDHVSHQSRPIWYDGKDLVKKLVVRLLALCMSAESWLDATNDSLADHLDPSTLYSKATNILVHILCQLLASPFRRETSQRIVAHSILWDVLGLTSGEPRTFLELSFSVSSRCRYPKHITG